jgi:glucose-6-phosphate 1-dehydrogenase
MNVSYSRTKKIPGRAGARLIQTTCVFGKNCITSFLNLCFQYEENINWFLIYFHISSGKYIKIDINTVAIYFKQMKSLIEQFMNQLTEDEVLVLQIAKTQLASSFNLVKSIGFIAWLKTNSKTARS